MPLSAPASRTHLHTRTVTCQGFLRDDGLFDIEGRIVDVKTYGFDSSWRGRVEPGTPVHDMSIRLTVDDSLAIRAVDASSDHHPFQICPQVTPNFQRLVGARIGPGFTREVRKRVGGVEGCTHIVEMLGQVATTAFQTVYADRARALRKEQKGTAAEAPKPADPAAAKRRPYVLDTCHAWDSRGDLVKKHMPEHYVGQDKPAA
jgi:hypothetical protein